ncbi:hydrolase, carbon-nitrogen family protein [Cardiosporidium cionae]|uniref:Hydrolase, carbon-nitrogen family protein n=1 Tax=Cardiosporidium cionae TaxID=476202 RepID=A0ABQ7J8Z9_9APIC|nr:hydrolase, carbon-nitrogen family protein [Cardiosporidium cionae]|eukprot:KAF8820135.1 hydrolase, carbon-nitrogen family protein [Cardiosporidium cionae]
MKIGLLQTPGLSVATVTAPLLAKTRQFQWIFQSLKKASRQEDSTGKFCDVLVLPEMWNTPYNIACFRHFAEVIPPVNSMPFKNQSVEYTTKVSEILSTSGVSDSDVLAQLKDILQTVSHDTQIAHSSNNETNDSTLLESCISTAVLAVIARVFRVLVIGGTISEMDALGNVYNCATVFNSNGTLVAKYRKTHLFDIDIPNKIKFVESETLSPGGNITTFSTEWGIIGLGICYDMRFPELAMCMRRKGAVILIYPGSFNTTTGPAHWQLLLRARAVDNQCFVVGCAPGISPQNEICVSNGDLKEYPAYGHTTIVNPWGTVLLDAGESIGYFSCDVDLDEVERTRLQIPISKQKRTDLYEVLDIME